jgi:hypothetical protein
MQQWDRSGDGLIPLEEFEEYYKGGHRVGWSEIEWDGMTWDGIE